MSDYNWTDKERMRIEKRIIDNVTLNMMNYINTKYNIFEKTVAAHAQGVQNTYSEMRILKDRVLILENGKEEEEEESFILLPCPFCGDKEIDLQDGERELHVFICDNCGCQSAESDELQEAAKSWNRRL